MATRLLGAAMIAIFLGTQLVTAQQCGSQAGGQTCANNFCCSKFGYCGTTLDYCYEGCQSQCSGGGQTSGVASFYDPPYVPSACFGFDQGQFPGNQYFAAGGDGAPNIWNNGANCGRYFHIQCTGNGCISSQTISIRIVDRCPNGCVGGRAFDLSNAAFNAIADPNVGVITVLYSGPFDS